MIVTATVLLATGSLTSYAPGVMAEVVANRQSWGQIEGVHPADGLALVGG